MKFYTYYAEDDDFYNIIDDIVKMGDHSDEILYSNLKIENEEGEEIFAIEDDSNSITFDYNFFISFMKDYTDKVIKNYLDNIHYTIKED